VIFQTQKIKLGPSWFNGPGIPASSVLDPWLMHWLWEEIDTLGGMTKWLYELALWACTG